MEKYILNGWKEIGAYLRRGTRTVQRWELCFGMPVHRPANRPRTAVIAFSEELQVWLRGNAALLSADSEVPLSPALSFKLIQEVDRLESKSKEITAKLSDIRAQLGGKPNSLVEPR